MKESIVAKKFVQNHVELMENALMVYVYVIKDGQEQNVQLNYVKMDVISMDIVILVNVCVIKTGMDLIVHKKNAQINAQEMANVEKILLVNVKMAFLEMIVHRNRVQIIAMKEDIVLMVYVIVKLDLLD
jgi:hypothetical protein